MYYEIIDIVSNTSYQNYKGYTEKLLYNITFDYFIIIINDKYGH